MTCCGCSLLVLDIALSDILKLNVLYWSDSFCKGFSAGL